MQEYVDDVQLYLTKLEKQIEKAQASTRRNATRLLREASHQVGVIETRGQKAWARLTTKYRLEAVEMLQRLETAIAPPESKQKRQRKTRSKKKSTKGD